MEGVGVRPYYYGMNYYLVFTLSILVVLNVMEVAMIIGLVRALGKVSTRLARIESHEPPADGGI